jgi:hypothetical protein
LSRTGVIKNLVNVKRSSVHLGSDGRIRFTYDASSVTNFKIYFQATEDLSMQKFPLISTKLDVIESGKCGPGLDLEWSFKVPFDLGNEWEYSENVGNFPIVIETQPLEEEDVASQLTYISVVGNRKKALVVKQKLRFGDRGYELHEIFGIEKTATDKSPMSVKSNKSDVSGHIEYNEEDINGTDCVICLSEPRDTTVLPCRHLCLCSRCAEVLRINSRRCPICRQPVSSMLQIDRDIPVSPLPTSPFRSLQIPE